MKGTLRKIKRYKRDDKRTAVPCTYVCPPYAVSLGILRQKFYLPDSHKVSSRKGGVGEGVVTTTKDTSNQAIEERCAWLWKRLDNVKSEQTLTELIW